ncbi:transcription factor IIA, alpha/beta subunit [Mollisia scopiformis]|uniref:Transcription initiation factor IIA large subunit n=1 Tax=Mollisia scopiformis TaxID=149040 RepID=A0A132B8L8_MOLSC|nr:transcription factor IIA, alpha/beta subunit [Mollisia scopiformis]KUJ08745.1 transcription factor IIA, alpha/beta subunit [Mollisia scopiformis]
MSNTQVGNIYQQIISDVVDTSRVDFEEGGVDEQVLEELRLGWQQKLSQLGVATFPWDPKPEPTPQIANPPTVPSNAGNYQPMNNTPPVQQPQSGLTMPQPSNNGNAPRIKTEPGLENNGNNGAAPLPYSGPTPAQQRAAAHLHQSYGPRAAASINAIQGGRPQQQQQNGQQSMMPTMEQMQQVRQMQQAQQQQSAIPQGLTMPQGQMQGRPNITQDQYQRMLAATTQRQMQQATANGQNGVGGAQTDGAGDEVESLGIIKRFDADGREIAMGRVEIDGLIRQKIEAMGSAMEGGGLMLPLHKASTPAKRSRKVKRLAPALAQADGGDDEDDKDGIKDEELDEDAINSDLDDPDDGLNEEEDEDEGMGHIMLCMYDKVQRVKNKWKCVMKDGVLTVNGKEYVFHKASGEYEW